LKYLCNFQNVFDFEALALAIKQLPGKITVMQCVGANYSTDVMPEH